MKSKRSLAIIALGGSLAMFFACLAFAHGQLPARIATHFNAAGSPDAWSDRGAFVAGFASLVVILDLLILGMLWAVRFLPDSFINLPHRDYWLAPERRGASVSALLTWAIFLASSLTLLHTGLCLLIVRANQHSPAKLDGVEILTAVFLGVFVVQIAFLWRRFSNPPRGSSSGVV